MKRWLEVHLSFKMIYFLLLFKSLNVLITKKEFHSFISLLVGIFQPLAVSRHQVIHFHVCFFSHPLVSLIAYIPLCAYLHMCAFVVSSSMHRELTPSLRVNHLLWRNTLTECTHVSMVSAVAVTAEGEERGTQSATHLVFNSAVPLMTSINAICNIIYSGKG